MWYLSKAAGAPCPFAKAGIRLCDYNEDGKVGMPINPGREKKRERDRLRKAAQTAGQKRKRLLRSCADKGSESETDSSDEEEKRPPKVKLTLRLKPCLAATASASSESPASGSQPPYLDPHTTDDESASDESDADSMSIDSESEDSPVSPSYLRPSMSVFPPSLPDLLPPPPPGFHSHPGGCRRSPSVPYSVFSGSPPPESEPEDEDFHAIMTGAQRSPSGRLRSPVDEDDFASDDDFLGDFDLETETQWESPGPRSPSVQIEDDVIVKEEPTDVSGLLDAWEHQESRATERKVIDIVAQAAAEEREAEQSALDDFALWRWPSLHTEEPEHIKQEDVETSLFFPDDHRSPPPESLSPLVPFDPCESPIEECPLHIHRPPRAFEMQWRDVEILGPDSVKPRDLDDGAWHEYRGARAVSPEESMESPSPEPSTAAVASPSSSPKLTRHTLTPLDMQSPSDTFLRPGRNTSITSPTLITSLTSLSIQSTQTMASTASSLAVAPQGSQRTMQSHAISEVDLPVIHTVLPCTPALTATMFEGAMMRNFHEPRETNISNLVPSGVAVYQMTVGSTMFLRRMDTHFVNLSSITQHLDGSCPSAPNAVTITAGSPPICGTWVPLSVAQEVAGSEPTFKVFLSDELHLLFPDDVNALCTEHREPPHLVFGHQFKSASDARRLSMASHRLELPPREFEVSWEDHLSTHPPFILATAAIDGHRPATEEVPAPVETPLSPTEEEMFHVLCAAPEWDCPPQKAPEMVEDAEDEATASARAEASETAQERPLRRSKRVANAVATRSRTRSSRRGSRTSLS